MILIHFPVIPPCARPSVSEIGSIPSDDDLTQRINEIVKVNKQLSKLKNDRKLLSNSLKKEEYEKYYNKLKTLILTFYNNSSGKATRHTSNRPIKGISERLKGKEGRMRKHIMGKRVDYSARTVITPDAKLPFGTLGIPRQVANTLTFSKKL